MRIWQVLEGGATVKLHSADVVGFLQILQRKGIAVEEVKFRDELTVEFRIEQRNVAWLQQLVRQRGEEMVILKRQGLFWGIQSLYKRPLLVGGIALYLLLTVFLPTRIFFFRVEGNEKIPANRILEIASQCGLEFGAQRRQLRSEKVKNSILEALPQLEWAGINTAGCVATISVRERQIISAPSEAGGVSSIIAVRDGVVDEVTVTNGSPVCKVGQVVKEGQILISGYTDCGISIRATRAKGEVYATTNHKFSAVLPTNWQLRGEQTVKKKKISIIIGKKRINFYQGSGILDANCVRMYAEHAITLPGGFVLPITVVTETWISNEQKADADSIGDQSGRLSQLAEHYLCNQMVAGTVLSRREEFEQTDDTLILNGEYACHEMIGREQSDEILKP